MPEKYYKISDPQKKLFKSIRAPLFLNQAHWVPFLLRFSGSFIRFSEFFQDFIGLCPEFHQIKTFRGAVSPPAPPFPTPVACTFNVQYLHQMELNCATDEHNRY